MNAAKIVYRPVGLLLSVASGALAGAAFKQMWKVVGHDDDTPDALDEERAWKEVLIAAALHGLIFAVVKAAVSRSGATATRRLTGTWPA
ncbi:DUF4235 domain-containing protein [Streptomyces sp. NPDC088197]|uniref:DUF4235 domain-containing protein n=1 Tax=unclassified Streptomyces TaxID=2593676 RepID=UPI0036EC67BA